MDDDFKYDVFLSHSSKDKEVVRAVAERLRADGLRVWFDSWVLKPGDNLPKKLGDGLEESRVLVLFMSVNAFGSDWAQLEAGTFRFRDPLNKELRFIPLRLDTAHIPGSLAQFLYINWLPEEREQEYAKLLEACRPPAKLLATAALLMEERPPIDAKSDGNGDIEPTLVSDPSDVAPPNSGIAEPTMSDQIAQLGTGEVEKIVEMTTQPTSSPIGDVWSGLRGLLQQAYSTSIIKGILGKAGLAIYKIEYTGTYKGPFLDEADVLVRSLDDQARDRFVVGCIQEIVALERTKAAKYGTESDSQTVRELQQVLSRFGHDLSHFEQA